MRDYFYNYCHIDNKEVITDSVSILCDNKNQHKLLMSEKYNIIQYAYNQYEFYGKTGEHQQVASSEDHTTYIEAIIGAIYYDAGFDVVKEWVLNWLFPKLSEMKDSEKM